MWAMIPLDWAAAHDFADESGVSGVWMAFLFPQDLDPELKVIKSQWLKMDRALAGSAHLLLFLAGTKELTAEDGVPVERDTLAYPAGYDAAMVDLAEGLGFSVGKLPLLTIFSGLPDRRKINLTFSARDADAFGRLVRSVTDCIQRARLETDSRPVRDWARRDELLAVSIHRNLLGLKIRGCLTETVNLIDLPKALTRAAIGSLRGPG